MATDANKGYGDKQAVRILTVDKKKRRIECALRDGAAVYAAVWDIPMVFRWPKTGEVWMIRKDNGIWRLDALVQDTDHINNASLSDLLEGEARVQADTLWNDKGVRFLTTQDGGGGGSSDYFNVKDHGAVGDGIVNDTAAVVATAAIATAAGGGTVFFPKGTYLLSTTIDGITLTDKVRFLGVGSRSVIQCAENPADGTRMFFLPNDVSASFEKLSILGPAAWTDGDTFIAIETYYMTDKLHIEDCLIRGYGYTVRGSADSQTLYDLVNSEFDGGLAGQTNNGAQGIVHSGGPGAAVHVDNCYLHGYGNSAGNNLCHSFYIYTSVSWRIENCHLADQNGGFYLTSFGGTGDAEYAIWENNYCAPAQDPFACIQTNPTVHTLIEGSTFAMGERGVLLQGDATISDCTFAGDGGGDFWQLEVTDNTSDYSLAVNGCRFLGENNITDALIQTDATVRVAFSECVFKTNSDRAVHLDADSTTAKVSFTDCTFLGISDTAAIYAAGGELQVHGSRFGNAGRGIHTPDTQAPNLLTFSHNDFSQGGASVRFGATGVPASWEAHDNYGSMGFPTHRGGTASVANGGTIAHGLGSGPVPITPTKYGLTPTVAKHIACVTAVDATNLTISLHNDAGTAIAVAENVVWWAEQ